MGEQGNDSMTTTTKNSMKQTTKNKQEKADTRTQNKHIKAMANAEKQGHKLKYKRYKGTKTKKCNDGQRHTPEKQQRQK